MQTSGIHPRPVGLAFLGGELGNWHSNRLSGVGVGESRMLKFNNKYCSEDPFPPRRCPGLCTGCHGRCSIWFAEGNRKSHPSPQTT